MLQGSIASVTAHKTALKHYSTKKSILQCLKKKNCYSWYSIIFCYINEDKWTRILLKKLLELCRQNFHFLVDNCCQGLVELIWAEV